MAKKKKREKNKKIKIEKKSLFERLNLKAETVHFTYASLILFISLFFAAAAFGQGGKLGDFLFQKLSIFLGVGYFLIPLGFFLLSISFFKDIKKKINKVKIFGLILFIISALGFIDLVSDRGGWLGSIISQTEQYLGTPMSIVLSLFLVAISQVIIFDSVPSFNFGKKEEDEEGEIEIEINQGKNKLKLGKVKKEKVLNLFDGDEKKVEEKKEKKKGESSFIISGLGKKKKEKKEESDIVINNEKENLMGQKIILPPVSLLSRDKGRPDAGDIEKNALLIKETLKSFGISVQIESVSVGPSVTRYSLRPATGVKVSRISALADDLALALAAKSIIIQTPIPGQSLVGIEIPNKNKIIVGAGDLFSSKEFIDSEYALPLALGKDISGRTTVIGLDVAPHLLIAGTTGAGKSVTVHAILNSLLYKHGPDSLKFLLIDPKRVEMTLYNGIPHLLKPTITDPKEAILALRWAISEMERRYEILEKYRLRDIKSYRENILKKKKNDEVFEAMPYIVIVIDELADIMQQFPRELESGIVSIAQKARAVGIHLILSTQRPSVNVVTGLIKANVPTRIALRVNSAVDSKTILDMAGAEKLLGKGDMLYKTDAMPKPARVQSAFISETEVKSVVRFIKKAYKDILNEEIEFENGEKGGSQELSHIDFDELEEEMDLDPLFNEAREEVILSGKASTSYLQRKFGIGYNRAARIIDQLEAKGVVSAANGSKPREVLVKKVEDIEN